MSKLNQLWNKFNQLKKELKAAKGTSNYPIKQNQLLDVYDQIQELESKVLVWGGLRN